MNYCRLKDLSNEVLIPKNWFNELFTKGYATYFHIHPQFEFMYCAKGSFSFEYIKNSETVNAEKIEIYENSFILINTDCYHKISINDIARVYNVELEPIKHSNKAFNYPFNKFSLPAKELFSINKQLADIKEQNKPFYVFNDTQKVLHTLKSIIEEVNAPQHPDSQFKVQLMIVKMFIDTSHCVFDDININTGFPYIKKAVSFMRQNFQRQPGINEIASYAGVSSRYLQRLFKMELNDKIHNVLTKIKLENAKYLLETTNLNNSEIAKLSGFKSHEILTYEFKKIEKCTPYTYRRKLHEKRIRRFLNTGEIKLDI